MLNFYNYTLTIYRCICLDSVSQQPRFEAKLGQRQSTWKCHGSTFKNSINLLVFFGLLDIFNLLLKMVKTF